MGRSQFWGDGSTGMYFLSSRPLLTIFLVFTEISVVLLTRIIFYLQDSKTSWLLQKVFGKQIYCPDNFHNYNIQCLSMFITGTWALFCPRLSLFLDFHPKYYISIGNLVCYIPQPEKWTEYLPFCLDLLSLWSVGQEIRAKLVLNFVYWTKQWHVLILAHFPSLHVFTDLMKIRHDFNYFFNGVVTRYIWT